MFVRLFTACWSKAGGAVAAFPVRRKPRWEGVMVLPPPSGCLGPPPFSFLIFGLGWRRLAYFMQKVMANAVAKAKPGKKRETKGRVGQD